MTTLKAPDNNITNEFTAIVDASRKADLSFKVDGELIEILVKQGDKVKKDQIIATLNDTDIKLHLQEAQSSYDKTKADYDRSKNLIKLSMISQSDFDQSKAAYNSTLTKLEGAKNNLQYTELKASFDGVIAKKYTDNYQEVNAKQPIVALHDLTNINLKVNIPGNVMIKVKKNRKNRKIFAIFDSIEGMEFPLSFKEVVTEADEVTQTYEVTFTMVPPAEYAILPGMSARVRSEITPSDKSTTSYYLPPAVVLKDNSGNYVYTVSPIDVNKGKIMRTPVTVGELTPLGIEIYSGIKENDQVITAGLTGC